MRSRSYHRRISEDVPQLSQPQSFPSKLSYDQCFVFGVPKKIDLDHFGYLHVRSIKLEWDCQPSQAVIRYDHDRERLLKRS